MTRELSLARVDWIAVALPASSAGQKLGAARPKGPLGTMCLDEQCLRQGTILDPIFKLDRFSAMIELLIVPCDATVIVVERREQELAGAKVRVV